MTPVCPKISAAFRLLALAGALLCMVAASSRAAEEIKVPFNFRWGDASQLVEDTIERAQARVVDRKVVNGRKVLVVEGHPDPRLKRSLFSFDNDSLVEVELQYGDDAWDGQKFASIFEQTRRNLDRKYGTSRNIARQTSREGDVVQTIVGYQWTQSYTSLRLILYTAEKGAETFRMLSYHYRGF
ncbi:MAG: hypothetical protein PHC88_03680 [Terrimicrobiaceae bacterium]|nr:hypothetical protein [Terrimicrobiaceae bacterium]